MTQDPKTIGSILTIKPANANIAKADIENHRDLSHAAASKLIERLLRENDDRRNTEVSAA